MNLYKLIRPLLFSLDAEKAHDLVFWLSERFQDWPNGSETNTYPRLKTTLAGLSLRNPLGLAAGMDKNARLLPLWKSLGFGFAEIGTVTLKPQEGNPKPRIFRVTESQSIINRLGFNNDGALAIAKRLENRPKDFVVGANIGKNKTTPLEAAARDYQESFAILCPMVDYITINISSPNTSGLRSLQDPILLRGLLKNISHQRMQYRQDSLPIFLKLSPDIDYSDAEEIVAIVTGEGFSGLILTNTTINLDLLPASDRSWLGEHPGGLSGPLLFERSFLLQQHFLRFTKGKMPIIASGGISTGADLHKVLSNGATAAQIYTSIIYKGPKIIQECLEFVDKS
ncbi:dihydroorotate dehydrogenase [Acidobacteriota bacterium]|nr:dihydroorotate dehydrogenase [Acidobacteriota bacterium]